MNTLFHFTFILGCFLVLIVYFYVFINFLNVCVILTLCFIISVQILLYSTLHFDKYSIKKVIIIVVITTFSYICVFWFINVCFTK